MIDDLLWLKTKHAGFDQNDLATAVDNLGRQIDSARASKGSCADFLVRHDPELLRMLLRLQTPSGRFDLIFSRIARLENDTDRLAMGIAIFGPQAGPAMTAIAINGWSSSETGEGEG